MLSFPHQSAKEASMTTRIAATLCVAAALALPGTAAARPIDDRPVMPAASPAPETVTIVRDSDDTLPLAVASAALLVAMGTAGLTFVRLSPRRAHS
jgi:hypothetical protein